MALPLQKTKHVMADWLSLVWGPFCICIYYLYLINGASLHKTRHNGHHSPHLHIIIHHITTLLTFQLQWPSPLTIPTYTNIPHKIPHTHSQTKEVNWWGWSILSSFFLGSRGREEGFNGGGSWGWWWWLTLRCTQPKDYTELPSEFWGRMGVRKDLELTHIHL